MTFDLDPAARVLVLAPPPGPVSEFVSLLLSIAEALPQGSLVAMAEDLDMVSATRRALAERDNVMIVPAPPHEIPWQQGFFTVVVDPRGEWPNATGVEREVRRVLAEGGVVHVLGRDR